MRIIIHAISVDCWLQCSVLTPQHTLTDSHFRCLLLQILPFKIEYVLRGEQVSPIPDVLPNVVNKCSLICLGFGRDNQCIIRLHEKYMACLSFFMLHWVIFNELAKSEDHVAPFFGGHLSTVNASQKLDQLINNKSQVTNTAKCVWISCCY